MEQVTRGSRLGVDNAKIVPRRRHDPAASERQGHPSVSPSDPQRWRVFLAFHPSRLAARHGARGARLEPPPKAALEGSGPWRSLRRRAGSLRIRLDDFLCELVLNGLGEVDPCKLP